MIGSFFERLKNGLTRTREAIVDRVAAAVGTKTSLDDAVLEAIEDALLLSDAGVSVTERVLTTLRRRRREVHGDVATAVLAVLREEYVAILGSSGGRTGELLVPSSPRPYVIMVVGVNGAGKTTTVGKLAWILQRSGLKVLIGSGDTFRAAAHDQLGIWAERAGAEIIGATSSSTDPASVAFDSLKAGVARGVDVVLLDTAGRLHTKTHLMEELRKIRRVAGKSLEGAPHEVLLVVDATTGQNGIQQARQFADAAGVTGVVLTKLDGTAKGGVVLGIVAEHNFPVRFVGVGEGPDDLQPFDADAFLRAMLPPAVTAAGETT